MLISRGDQPASPTGYGGGTFRTGRTQLVEDLSR